MPIINMVYKKKKWWKPWANTIAYYPLKADFNDASWNNKNLTNTWSPSITTYWWVACASYSSWNNYSYYNGSIWATATARTISVWLNIPTALDAWIWWIATSNNYWKWWLWFTEKSWQIWVSDFWAGQDRFAYPSWWFNIIAAQEWSTIKAYLNWTLVKTYTNQDTTWSWATAPNILKIWWKPWSNGGWADSNFAWYVSEFILENKTRTADEATKYYNSTKSNYWL